MEREPDLLPVPDDDDELDLFGDPELDLFGDPDEIEGSIEEDLDERLDEERPPD